MSDNSRTSQVRLPFALGSLALLAVGVLQAWWLGEPAAQELLLPTQLGASAWMLLRILSLLGAGVLSWRCWLVARYQAVPAVPIDRLPSITVVVPAFNEGRQVYEALRSIARNGYPADRLQVLAMDDGSTDDTWRWMERARRDFGDVVTAVRRRQNRGKRFTLYEAFQRAQGELVVTVDSDSEVLPGTLANLVSPMVTDERVGAVAVPPKCLTNVS